MRKVVKFILAILFIQAFILASAVLWSVENIFREEDAFEDKLGEVVFSRWVSWLTFDQVNLFGDDDGDQTDN
jgi:hypothetical protein